MKYQEKQEEGILESTVANEEDERREGSESADKAPARLGSVHDGYFHAMLDDRSFVARYTHRL